MSKSSKLAARNATQLASIGMAAMEHEGLRRTAFIELSALRRARRDEDVEPSEYAAFERKYQAAAKARKNARERMLRMMSRYRTWLAEVNA